MSEMSSFVEALYLTRPSVSQIRKLNAKLEKADQDLRAALAKIEKLEKAKSANPEPSRTTTRRPSPPSIFADEPTEDVLGIFDVRDNGQTASKQEVEPQEDDAVVVLDSDENEEVEDDDDDDLFGGVIVPGMGAFRKSVKVPTAKVSLGAYDPATCLGRPYR